MEWLDLLQREVAKSNITQVAKVLGYSRSAVSLALSGNYVGSTDQLAARVVAVFSENLICPHLSMTISFDECQEFQTRAIPQSNAAALRHWRACQTCPHRIETGGTNAAE